MLGLDFSSRGVETHSGSIPPPRRRHAVDIVQAADVAALDWQCICVAFCLAVLFLVLQFCASSWMPPRDFVCEGNVLLIVGLCCLSDFRLNVLRLRASRPLSTGSCKSTWTWRLFACLVVLVYFEHSPTRWTSDGSADSFNC